MGSYRVHFLTHAGEIYSSIMFNAEHDEAAKEHVQQVLSGGIGKGHEIWQDERLVHTEIYR